MYFIFSPRLKKLFLNHPLSYHSRSHWKRETRLPRVKFFPKDGTDSGKMGTAAFLPVSDRPEVSLRREKHMLE
ncbi:hypothetical protein DWY22_05340 [Heyndrickxia coagulans]|nr:hypothetical protein DWY22_05340 [Heyndrickxia coagulans]RGR99326.1 hypothetical protein DWY16_05495 [Heyndrickxia coagulans]